MGDWDPIPEELERRGSAAIAMGGADRIESLMTRCGRRWLSVARFTRPLSVRLALPRKAAQRMRNAYAGGHNSDDDGPWDRASLSGDR